MNAPETSYGPFRKVGILVEKVGILEGTSFGVKNSTVTAGSSSPRAKVDSERRSRRQHRIEGTSVRYERAFTGAVPMNVWATVNGPTRSTSLLAGPDRTFLGRNDEHVRAVASCLLSSTRTFQPESRLFETGRMTSPSRGNLLFSIWSRFHSI